MERNVQEISKETAERKEEDLDVTVAQSESNFLLERYLVDSTSAEKLTYPNTMTDENTLTCKRKNDLEDQPSKKRQENVEIKVNEEQMQVSAVAEDSSMERKESSAQISDMANNDKQMNLSEELEVSSIDPYVFQSMSAENNPFISETIYLSKGTLCFERTHTLARSKPLGCKTIFVSGLPLKITEDIIKDIFQRCGSVDAIKMTGNESYVTFSEEISVEFAMRYSGYRLKIDNKNEAPYSGILFMDYAPAEFDHHGEHSYRSVTPSFVHYTDNAVPLICERLNRDETFTQAASIIMMWLEQEECSNENSASFFSMLQCIHNHVIKLYDKKNEYEVILKDAKTTLIKHFKEILCSLAKVEHIYLRVSLDQCSDLFTLEEKKNIELWEKFAKKLILNIKRNIRGIKNEQKADQDNECLKVKKELNENMQKFNNEQNSLKQQLKEVQNSIATIKSNNKKEIEHLDKHIADMHNGLRKSQKGILRLREICLANEIEIRQLRSSIYEQNTDRELEHDPAHLSHDQARVISLVCIFLRVNPGASLDSVYSYLHGIDSTINCRSVEILMRRFPTIFQEDVVVIGTNFQRKWYFVE